MQQAKKIEEGNHGTVSHIMSRDPDKELVGLDEYKRILVLFGAMVLFSE